MRLILTLALLLAMLVAACSSNKRALEEPFLTAIPDCVSLGRDFSQAAQWTDSSSKEYAFIGAHAHVRECKYSGVKLTMLALAFATDAESTGEFIAQTTDMRARQHRDASGSFDLYPIALEERSNFFLDPQGIAKAASWAEVRLPTEQSNTYSYATGVLFQIKGTLASVIAERRDRDPLPPAVIDAVARASDQMAKSLVPLRSNQP